MFLIFSDFLRLLGFFIVIVLFFFFGLFYVLMLLWSWSCSVYLSLKNIGLGPWLCLLLILSHGLVLVLVLVFLLVWVLVFFVLVLIFNHSYFFKWRGRIGLNTVPKTIMESDQSQNFSMNIVIFKETNKKLELNPISQGGGTKCPLIFKKKNSPNF